MNFILAQLFGLIAVILFVSSYQLKNKNALIIAQLIGTVAMSTNYLLLGAYSGMALNIVCIIRNIVYFFNSKRQKPFLFVPYLMTFVMIAVGIFTWQGWQSLVIIAALAINTFCMSLSFKKLRISILFTCTMVFIYDIFVFSFLGALNEGLSVISSALALWRLRKKEQ